MEDLVMRELMRKDWFDSYRGKRVLITGHTGFKGSWLCRMLAIAGADVAGYSLEPPTIPSLFELASISEEIRDERGDVRDIDALRRVFASFQPDIVFHLAAQPIVREGYTDPVGTYATNVMGTVNVLECARQCDNVQSVVNVTTDKVYANREWEWGYRETDELCGADPYSNSKSCSELVTYAYKVSYFDAVDIPVSTVRAGNVIGGGDFAPNRIIPDCVRAAIAGQSVKVRNPDSTRPYQHVIEPLSAYMMIAICQLEDSSLADSYNVGPGEAGCCKTGELVDFFSDAWGGGFSWEPVLSDGPHEAGLLKLDCSKIESVFGWSPRWSIRDAVSKTVEWARAWQSDWNIVECMDKQIGDYLKQ